MTPFPNLGARHTLAVMGFFGILNVYFSRIDMSIAIVAMVGRDSVTKADSNATLCEIRCLSYQKCTNIGLQIFVTYTVYILVPFHQARQVFYYHFESVVLKNTCKID
jgi:hypothetical protein